MFKGVLIDWGGVLTTGLREAIDVWIAAERIDPGRYRDVMRELVMQAYEAGPDGENLIHALERGEISALDFERDLARRLLTLDGVPPVAEGLLTRMFAGFQPVQPMYDMLAAARAAGLKTCLLSNSWANDYPRDSWDGLFDEIVISGEVGMRKPEPRIFEYTLDLVGLSGTECVFIDDIEANITAAGALGITGLHHREPADTITRLEGLLGVPLR
ncbi:HAD family hydrolase [Planomonospora corallina]|uniref:HAD family hydrolase n=1 Tax=Planomonospora corallina TaxID=1806052 RepID=A0ABV8I4V2_9ACTN